MGIIIGGMAMWEDWTDGDITGLTGFTAGDIALAEAVSSVALVLIGDAFMSPG